VSLRVNFCRAISENARLLYPTKLPRRSSAIRSASPEQPSGGLRFANPPYALKIPPAFFFEGAPSARLYRNIAGVPTLDLLSTFPIAVEDFALLKSYLHIKSAKMRHCILALVQATDDEDR
jgi:hypothetical protein